MFRYTPHKYQELFHKSTARVRSCFSGRRGGKSISGQFEDIYWLDRGISKCCRTLTGYDKEGYYCPKCKRRLEEKDIEKVVGLLVAPTYKAFDDVNVPIFRELLGPDAFDRAWKDQKKVLELPHGTLYCRSADRPEQIGRGGKYHFIHIDEARDCKRLGTLTSTLWPTLADYHGSLWITTTTNGRDEAWKEFYNPSSVIYKPKDPLSLKPQDPIKEINKDGDPDYALFTWRTSDNTILPHLQDEVRDSKKRMPEWKWRQEYFATVEQFRGLVYPMFNMNSHVVDPLQFDRDDILYIGIDVGWNHPTAVTFMIKSYEGNYYIVDELYERQKTVPQMVELINNKLTGLSKYCKQGITFEPHIFIIDPASRQKRQEGEGTSIFEQYQMAGIPVIDGINDVRAGIDRVSQYLTNEVGEGRELMVFNTCKHTIEEFSSYRWKDNKDGELVDEVYKEKDDLCLVGDTKVMTSKGEKKIKDIVKGNEVYTRKGLRVVENSKLTRTNEKIVRVYTTEGSFDCTPDHKIITKDGKVRVDAIRYGIIYTWRENIKEKHIHGMGSILRGLERIRRQFTCYIGLFGKIITELFQKVWLYITLTIMELIMKSIIFKYLKEESIRVFMVKKDGIIQQLKCSNILTVSETLQKSGIGAKRGKSGIGNMGKNVGNLERKLKRNANIVENSLKQKHTIRGSAQTTVNQHTEGGRGLTILLQYVLYVVKSLLKVNILKREPAHVLAVVNLAERQDVYNLTVDKIHEYYANGILVANCDSIRYLCMSHPEGATRPERDRWGAKIDPMDIYDQGRELMESSDDWMDSEDLPDIIDTN